MFECSNSKLYSEATYWHKTLKAADAVIFVKNFFVALNLILHLHYLFCFSNLKPFACSNTVYITVSKLLDHFLSKVCGRRTESS